MCRRRACVLERPSIASNRLATRAVARRHARRGSARRRRAQTESGLRSKARRYAKRPELPGRSKKGAANRRIRMPTGEGPSRNGAWRLPLWV